MNISRHHYPQIVVTMIIIASHALGQSAPQNKIWTSNDGRQIEATFVALEGGSVKIRTANGAEFAVPLVRLSAEDQAFAKNMASNSTAVALQAASPAASAAWPRTVTLEEKPVVTVVKEDAEKREFIYRSPHYEFQCDSKLGANVVREFGRMFEAAYLLNCTLPLDFKPAPEPLREFFLARLFTQKSDYMEAGGLEGSAGVYSRGKKALMVPLASLGVKMVGSRVSLENGSDQDNVVLIHEITHQMMNHWLNRLPTWYVEGAAEYVSMLEYNSNGRFSLIGLNRLLQNFARRRQSEGGGKSFTMIDLEELMTLDGGRWSAALGRGGAASENYGSAGLLTYFFYHLDGRGDAGHMIAYLREVAEAKTAPEKEAAIKKHLLRERSYAQLADEVKKALRKEGIDISYFPAGKNAPASSAN